MFETLPDDLKENSQNFRYNPPEDRWNEAVIFTNHRALRKGEEILDNYLDMISEDIYWVNEISKLNAVCNFGIDGFLENQVMDGDIELQRLV